MSIIGAIIIGCIKLFGIFTKKSFKLKKLGYCYYLEVGSNWGGLELGMFFLVGSRCGAATRWHEHGHAIQNCFWGVLYPIVIWIPSAIRYWYRTIKYSRKNITPPTKYDAIWFEGDATKTGRKYRAYFKK